MEYKAENSIKNRLMENVYPYGIPADRSEPFDVGRVAELRQPSRLCDYSEVASREEQEEPGHHREVIRGTERRVVKSQREQHADIVSLHRELYGEQIRDTDVTREIMPFA